MTETTAQKCDQPIANWTGRLLFSRENRLPNGAVQIEVHNAPPGFEEFVGRQIPLTWAPDSEMQQYSESVTMDVNLGDEARKSAAKGRVHPERLDGLENVGPLESMAAARAENDMHVALPGHVELSCGSLLIQKAPVQICGKVRCLVQFQETDDEELFPATHYNRQTGEFDGLQETVRIPKFGVDGRGIHRTTSKDIDKSPANKQGWYIYGDRDEQGQFTVRAFEPRRALQLDPDEVYLGFKTGRNYLRHLNWAQAQSRKGKVQSILVDPESDSREEAVSHWKEGDRAIVIHLFGGMVGDKINEINFTGLVTGHFAYGDATVVKDSFTGELVFDITHRHVYANNKEGIISGPNQWHSYMGDLYRGWMGSRPVSDIIIKFDPVTRDYEMGTFQFNAFQELIREINEMSARYRVGDGDGSSLVTTEVSCVQDSNQAMYAAICESEREAAEDANLKAWLEANSSDPQTSDLAQLNELGKSLEAYLTPFGIRRDWKNTSKGLNGMKRRKGIFWMLVRTLKTWRTMVPRRAHDSIGEIFLKHGAKLWFVRTNQVGGHDPTIRPVAATVPFGGADNKA